MFRFRFEATPAYCPIDLDDKPVIVTSVASTEDQARDKVYRALDGDFGLKLVSAHELTD